MTRGGGGEGRGLGSAGGGGGWRAIRRARRLSPRGASISKKKYRSQGGASISAHRRTRSVAPRPRRAHATRRRTLRLWPDAERRSPEYSCAVIVRPQNRSRTPTSAPMATERRSPDHWCETTTPQRLARERPRLAPRPGTADAETKRDQRSSHSSRTVSPRRLDRSQLCTSMNAERISFAISRPNPTPSSRSWIRAQNTCATSSRTIVSATARQAAAAARIKRARVSGRRHRSRARAPPRRRRTVAQFDVRRGHASRLDGKLGHRGEQRTD